MRELRLVIFDCDGVLVDSEAISNGVLAEMLSAEGLPTTLAQARRDFQGLLLDEVAARVEAKLGRPLPAGWLEAYESRRAGSFRRELQPVAGAAATVRRVTAAGIVVCVASQGRLAKTQLTLGLTGLLDLFAPDALFSAESVARPKPFPDLFLHAARAMGYEPSACAVVEDSPSGVAGARAAGMRAIGYAADSDAQALRAAGAQTLGSLERLPALLAID
jgi:HAD superfamily hydrolase (TIGR01509 family)